MNRSSGSGCTSRDDAATVIIPCFNPDPELFSRCLKSILDQTHADIRVIVVDDGSHGDVAAHLDSVAESDQRVRVIHQANGGVSSARNAGLRSTTSALVCFVDADDYVEPDFIASAANLIFESDADVVFGGITVKHRLMTARWRSLPRFDGSYVVVGPERLIEPRAMALADSPSPLSDSHLFSVTNVHGTLYKTSVARSTRFRTELSQAEDRLYNFDFLRSARRATFCSDAWYVYDRTVEESATRQVLSGPVTRLRPVMEVLASIACHPEEHGSAVDALEIRASAALALTKYVKLAAMMASSCRRPSRSSAVRELRRMLDEQEIAAALEYSPALSRVDSIFLAAARRRMAGTLVILGHLASKRNRTDDARA